jgi:hypothetical protein
MFFSSDGSRPMCLRVYSVWKNGVAKSNHPLAEKSRSSMSDITPRRSSATSGIGTSAVEAMAVVPIPAHLGVVRRLVQIVGLVPERFPA